MIIVIIYGSYNIFEYGKLWNVLEGKEVKKSSKDVTFWAYDDLYDRLGTKGEKVEMDVW